MEKIYRTSNHRRKQKPVLRQTLLLVICSIIIMMNGVLICMSAETGRSDETFSWPLFNGYIWSKGLVWHFIPV